MNKEIWPKNINPGDGLFYGDQWEQVLSRRINPLTRCVHAATVDVDGVIALRELPLDTKIVVRRRRNSGDPSTDQE